MGRCDFAERQRPSSACLSPLPSGLGVPSRSQVLLSLVFLFLVAGPATLAGGLMVYDWLDPPLRLVAAGDAAQVRRIFSGGEPWLVTCVTEKTARATPPKALARAAELLRGDGVRVARVHCWAPSDAFDPPKSPAARFGLKSRPPVALVTRGEGEPVTVAASGLQPKALAAKVRKTLKALAAARPKGGSSEAPSQRRGAPADEL